MKRIALVLVVLLAFILPSISCFADTTKTVAATLTWDGKDANGSGEASMPVTIKLYQDGTTPVLKSTITVTGSVTNAAMPTFTLTVADNVTTTFNFYATASDSATPPNVSPKSVSVPLTIVGKDTVAPGVPVINLILQ